MIILNKVETILEIGGKHIFRQMKEDVNHIAYAPEMLKYLKKYELGEAMECIDWGSHRTAKESLTQ